VAVVVVVEEMPRFFSLYPDVLCVLRVPLLAFVAPTYISSHAHSLLVSFLAGTYPY
jgi:hypothetical protein